MKTLFIGIRRIIASILIVCILGSITAVIANEDMAKQKFKEKIEKVVVGKILEDIKEKDYDTYRVLSAFWAGLKNQSGNAIVRNLRDLLIEKGFIFIIYQNAKEFVRPGLTDVLLGRDFYASMKEKRAKYSTATYKMYQYLSDNFTEYDEYFGEESLSILKDKLITYFRESPNTPVYFPEEKRKDFKVEVLGAEVADKIIKNEEIPFIKNFAFELPEVKNKFVAKVTASVQKMHEQTLAWYDAGNKEREEIGTIWGKDRIQQKVFRQVLLKHDVSYDELDKAYLDIVSFLIRIAMEGNVRSVNSKSISNFSNLAYLLNKVYPEFNAKKHSFTEITTELNRLMKKSINDEVKYNTWGGIRIFFNSMLWNANSLIKEYKSSGSFYHVFSAYKGWYLDKYFVNMWFNDFRVDSFKSDLPREYAVSGQEFWVFKKQVTFASIVADDIIKPNKANMVDTYKRFVLATLKDAPNGIKVFKDLSDKALKESKDKGLRDKDIDMIEATVNYAMKAESLSSYVVKVEKYTQEFIPKPRPTPGNLSSSDPEPAPDTIELAIKFQDSLNQGVFKNLPVFKNFLLKVFVAVTQRKDLSALKVELDGLDSLLFEELIRLGDYKITPFEYFYEVLNYSLPVVGISLKSILKILAAKENASFEAIVSQGFRQAVSYSVQQLPEDIRKVTEPFMNLAMNAILLGEDISMNEYTAVASNIIKALETQTRAFYMSIGIAWGSFAQTVNVQNVATATTLSKIFISDKVGIDFIGLGYDIAGRKVFSPLRMGIFAGGFLDYALSEAVKVDSRMLSGGDHYLKTGVFMAYDNPTQELAKFDISVGMAFNVKGDKSLYVAASWNLFELSDLF